MRRCPRRLLVLAALVATGCGQPLYVLRLGWAEARILWRREPIARVLEREAVDAVVRDRLALVLDVRRFARDALGLDVGTSYTTYSDVGDDAVVHVVTAAYRDRLEPLLWWYPIVGRVPYRGFFARAEAEAEALRLGQAGLDTDVRRAVAFSTLGWFADPVLSTVTRGARERVAETVIHELLHATVFVPGAVPFNESAATFVGHQGAIAFFCENTVVDPAACADARRVWDRTQARGRILTRYRARLVRWLARGSTPTQRDAGRWALAARVATTLERRGLGRREEMLPPNHARLLGELDYGTDIDLFEQVARGRSIRETVATIVAVAREGGDPWDALRARVVTPAGAGAAGGTRVSSGLGDG